MGCCFSGENSQTQSNTNDQYDRDRLRELQAQAAEKRMRENEHRGIKDLESVQRRIEQKKQMENIRDLPNDNGQGLKWQVN